MGRCLWVFSRGKHEPLSKKDFFESTMRMMCVLGTRGGGTVLCCGTNESLVDEEERI